MANVAEVEPVPASRDAVALRWLPYAAMGVAAVTLGTLLVLVMRWKPNIEEQPGNIVNAVVASANIAFVAFNFLLLRTAQRQIEMARSEAAATADQWRKDHDLAITRIAEERKVSDKQLEAAQKTYTEAVKTRLDSSAPKMSLALERVSLAHADTGVELEEGEVIDPSSAEGRISMRLTWRIQSWDDRPIRAFVPGDGQGNIWLRPGGFEDIEWSVSLPASAWHSATSQLLNSSTPDSTWHQERVVQANSPTNEMYDNHLWDGHIRPFDLDGSRLVVQERKWWVNCAPLARVERHYNNL